ncbi:HPP family protein [Luteolibacter ambystomatis]|uniref:HPP family protein n=1 Tax=Luteolibacter ambystomatis TaxID=2824561 RepID=A0A975J0N2_9BACT|nr:HPP family protein [Luteolibacter ambystomatis]QUE51853.1 HPP family protein [Luteolibacter ambystomatis]
MDHWRNWLGIELSPVSTKEKLLSMLGGFLSLLALVAISRSVLHLSGAAAVIASMGASAVLLFAVPHGQLSQPWPVIAGHGFSALIGVACAKWIPSPEIAAACAVGLSIGAMHQFKCIHPPGGATGLTAVLGGQAIHDLGFRFVFQPVLANALAMVSIAVIFNTFFPWRRYPAFVAKRRVAKAEPSHEAVVAALRSLDSFVDITEDDLIRLVGLLSPTPAAGNSAPRSERSDPPPAVPASLSGGSAGSAAACRD